jgi:hypothetical protein
VSAARNTVGAYLEYIGVREETGQDFKPMRSTFSENIELVLNGFMRCDIDIIEKGCLYFLYLIVAAQT